MVHLKSDEELLRQQLAASIALASNPHKAASKLIDGPEDTTALGIETPRDIAVILGEMFNLRFHDGFWSDVMHDAPEEIDRQICGWIDLYIGGIALDQKKFIETIKQPEYSKVARRHISKR